MDAEGRAAERIQVKLVAECSHKLREANLSTKRATQRADLAEARVRELTDLLGLESAKVVGHQVMREEAEEVLAESEKVVIAAAIETGELQKELAQVQALLWSTRKTKQLLHRVTALAKALHALQREAQELMTSKGSYDVSVEARLLREGEGAATFLQKLAQQAPGTAREDAI